MRTKAELVKFVKSKMDEKKLTKSSLGEVLGVKGAPQSKVQRANGFLSDKSQKINMSDILLVAQFLDLDPKDLLLKPSKDNKLSNDLPKLDINPNHLVPLMTPTKAGADEKLLNEWLVYPYDPSAHKKIVAIPMPDDRMNSFIPKGEILFVDNRLYSFDLNQQIVLASYQNQFIVGRFNLLEAGQIEISFDNPKAKTLRYSKDNEHLEILGVVISRFTKFN